MNSGEPSAFGTVSDISKAGLSVMIPTPMAPGDLVELEMADSVLAGHVIYSTPDTTLFRTGIEIDRIRLGSSDLSNLLQRTLNEAMPGTPGLDFEPSESYIG